MSRGSNPTKVRLWTVRLDRFEKSAQTVTQFCESEGVSQPSFYQWRKRLKGAGKRSGGEAGDEPVGVGAAPSPAFKPVQLTAPIFRQQQATIRLADGVEIELGNDPPVVGAVVEAVVKQVLALRAGRSEGRSC